MAQHGRHVQASTPQVGFEHTTAVVQRSKTTSTIEAAATGTGWIKNINKY